MTLRVKQVRNALKMTQEEFGNRLGIKRNTIACYETGVREPPENIIRSICREFNVDEHWLRTGEGEMFLSLSRREQVIRFLGSVGMKDENDIRYRLADALSRLSEDQWQMLADISDTLCAETQKKADP